MSGIWCFMVCASFVCAFFNGTVPETAAAVLDGAKDSVETLLSFAGIMCFWTGILKAGENAGLMKLIGRLFSPVIKCLFPKTGEEGRALITVNLCANLLGMGNAATPAGIRAMEALDRENAQPEKPSDDMRMFTILNTTSFTVFPATVVALRAAAGSAAPYDIVPAVWCVSAGAVVLGAVLVKLLK